MKIQATLSPRSILYIVAIVLAIFGFIAFKVYELSKKQAEAPLIFAGLMAVVVICCAVFLLFYLKSKKAFSSKVRKLGFKEQLTPIECWEPNSEQNYEQENYEEEKEHWQSTALIESAYGINKNYFVRIGRTYYSPERKAETKAHMVVCIMRGEKLKEYEKAISRFLELDRMEKASGKNYDHIRQQVIDEWWEDSMKIKSSEKFGSKTILANENLVEVTEKYDEKNFERQVEEAIEIGKKFLKS